MNNSQLNEIDDVIGKLEDLKSDLERAVAISRAQKALEEMIPLRLAENLELFKENFPDIYTHYADFKPSGKYQLICNENGEPNLLVNGKYLLYGKSPFDDNRDLVERNLKQMSFLHQLGPVSLEHDPIFQFHFYCKNRICEDVNALSADVEASGSNFESVPIMFMFGLGLGFQLGYLYERFTPLNLFILEPDEELFYYSLCVFDYKSLIGYIKNEHLGINFYLLHDPDEFVRNVNLYIIKHAGATIPMFVMSTYRDNVIDSFVRHAERDFASMIHTSGFFDDMLFGFAHSMTNISNGIPFLKESKLPGYVTNKPLILVGNGPSLDNDIELLEKYQDRCVIAACGTAFSALCRRGIQADIYIAVERTLDVYDSLVEIEQHREYFMNTVCFGLDVVHPKTLSMFKHKVVVFKGNELMPMWLTVNKCCILGQYALISRVNPLVSNFGFELVSKLGFENIFMVGIDNGSASEDNHSKYSVYFDDDHKIKKKYENMILNNMPLEMPGNFVDTVKTNSMFKLAARIMESTVATYPSTKYYNCSNGVRIVGAEPKHLNDLNWDEYSRIDKTTFRTILMSCCTQKLDFDLRKFKDNLDFDKFKQVMHEVYHDWDTKPKTRVEFVLREEYQSDYLKGHGSAGLIASLALSSSLSMYFNYFNKVLYSFSDEQKAVDLTYDLLRKHMLRFFKGCEYIYRHVTEFEIGKHVEIVQGAIDRTKDLVPDEILPS